MRHRRVLVPIVTALLVAACGAEPTPETTTTEPATTTTVLGAGPSTVFEIGATVNHPNGTQLRFERIELFQDSTVVEVGVSNGSRFGLELRRGTTQLIGDDGTTADLLLPLDSSDFRPGEDRSFNLVFAPLGDPKSVTLIVNRGGGSSPASPDTSAPSFEVGPVALDPDTGRPLLPAPAYLDRTSSTPAGVEVAIQGLVFTETRVGMAVTISNRSFADVAISPAAAPTYLADDQQNLYFLTLPEGQAFLTIKAGTAQAGVLSFAGRIDPRATTLQLGINDDRRGLGSAEFPRFLFTEIPVSGDTAESLVLPNPISVETSVDHPSGVSVTLTSIAFTDTGIETRIEATNSGTVSVALNGTTGIVQDDTGTRYLLRPADQNPSLVIAGSSAITATLFFSGRPKTDSTSITLSLNPGQSKTDPATRTPGFDFGPFALERTDPTGQVPEAQIFPVGLRTALADTELASSEVENVASILRQFNATPVEGGFRLTLPDDILFDFNSATLRADATPALALISEVLDFFEGDEVLILGHTDSIGSATYNRELSQRRADSVARHLEERHAIDPARLTAEGRGADEPVAPNNNPDGSDNPEGRQLNRRVEIVVLTDRPLPGQ